MKSAERWVLGESHFPRFLLLSPLFRSQREEFAEEAIIDDLERRIGTNPSKRDVVKPLLVYREATEEKCDVSWAYLSSY